MKWQETLLQECYRVLPRGGEVRIQFHLRKEDNIEKSVPIIRTYIDNQKVCEIVEIVED